MGLLITLFIRLMVFWLITMAALYTLSAIFGAIAIMAQYLPKPMLDFIISCYKAVASFVGAIYDKIVAFIQEIDIIMEYPNISLLILAFLIHSITFSIFDVDKVNLEICAFSSKIRRLCFGYFFTIFTACLIIEIAIEKMTEIPARIIAILLAIHITYSFATTFATIVVLVVYETYYYLKTLFKRIVAAIKRKIASLFGF